MGGSVGGATVNSIVRSFSSSCWFLLCCIYARSANRRYSPFSYRLSLSIPLDAAADMTRRCARCRIEKLTTTPPNKSDPPPPREIIIMPRHQRNIHHPSPTPKRNIPSTASTCRRARRTSPPSPVASGVAPLASTAIGTRCRRVSTWTSSVRTGSTSRSTPRTVITISE